MNSKNNLNSNQDTDKKSLIDLNSNLFKCPGFNVNSFSNECFFSNNEKGNNEVKSNAENKNFIEFHMKTNNHLSIKKSYNINEITNQKENSLLKVKINPNFQNEFALINSNFNVNYLVLNNDGAFNVGSFQEHQERINDLAFFKSENPLFSKAFVSAGNDGLIKIWDSRSPNSVKTLKTNGIKVFCLETSEDKLIAGFGREIGIWDLKTMKNICRYRSAHSEDVTCLKLKNKTQLLSGGEDGIINHINLEQGLNIDSIVATLNVGQPLASVDFLDENYNLVQANTTIYTMEICSFEKGSSQFSYNSQSDLYNTQYSLDAFLVENNNSLRNGNSSINQNNLKENIYKGENYSQLFCGNHS